MKPRSLTQAGALLALLAAVIILAWGLLHALGYATEAPPLHLLESLLIAGGATAVLGAERRDRERHGSTREIRRVRDLPPESGPGPLDHHA